MVIKTTQLQALGSAQSSRFIHDTVRRLRETEPLWAAGKSDGELCVQIEEIVQYAAGCRIRKRDAVITVIDAFVRYNPPRPPDARLTALLQQPNIPEIVRAEQFYLSLASGRYRLTELAPAP